MGTKYSTVTVSGYNSSAPADDGSQTAANQVKWSTIKTKLPDPLKTAIEAVNSNLLTALDFGSRQVTANDTTTAADYMKTIEIASSVSGSVTVSLGDAATMAAGYIVTVKNSSPNAQTISCITVGDKINGVDQDLTIPRQCSITFKVANTASQGYFTDRQFGGVFYDPADATKSAVFDLSGIPTGTQVTIPVASSGGAVPAGVIMDYAGSTVPTGWLSCDGTEYSNSAYPTLFAAIGTTWGGGAGTFKVPDFRGRTTIGDGTGTFSETVASGSIDVSANTLAVTSNNTKWITGMAVVYAGDANGLSSGTTYYVIRESATLVKLATTLANAQNGTAVDITSQGTGNHTLTVTWTARTLGNIGGQETHAMSSTEFLAHTHTTVRGNGGASDSNYFSYNGSQGSQSTTSANTQTVGGNAAMNIMQPFGVVKKIIKT